MNYQEVLEGIVSGRDFGETTADILTMVHMTENFIPSYSPKFIEHFHDDFPDARQHSSQRARVAHIAGSLLCLLFAPVKQKSYTTRMKAIRKRFSGLAESPSLQARFSDGLQKAAQARAFHGFDRASTELPNAFSNA